MSSIIGAPFIPPDDILIRINPATGKLELKPGTQGDILYAGASGTWTKLAAGTSGHVLKTFGAGNNPAWVALPLVVDTLLETMAYAGDNSKTSGALTAYDEYIVILDLLMSAGGNVNIRLNGDAGNNYVTFYMNGTTPTRTTGNNEPLIVGGSTTEKSYAVVRIRGKTPAVASGILSGHIMAGNVNSLQGLGFSWTGGNNTQISTITIKANAALTLTGNVYIYGRNFTS